MKAFAVYGSPGTGKTTELMWRIEDLRKRYKPTDIGFLSHTRAATAEALSRLKLRHSDNVSTVHGLCFRLLSMTREMVVDQAKAKDFSESIGIPMRGGSLDDNEQIEVGDEYLSIHNLATVTGRPVREVFDSAQSIGNWNQYRYFAEHYTAWKMKKGFLDFNDMLLTFTANPVPCGAKVLLIDEAQDMSPLQWAVINVLIKGGIEEAHIAGDDDQAIYVWGGADPQGMQQFEERHRAQRLVLPRSYRIPRRVHDLANSVIQRVRDRVPKQYAPRAEDGELIYHSESLHGVDLDDRSTMILARTGARKKEIEKFLIDRCTPYLTEGGFPGPLQNRTARALRAHRTLCRVGSVSNDELSMLKGESTEEAKNCIAENRLDDLARLEPFEAINVRPWLRRYYSTVDVECKPNTKLMTIHASKGREADRIILDTALTARVENSMVRDPDAEMRVFYVGITRARQQLDVIRTCGGFNI